MPGHVYKKVEIVGSSDTSIEDAVKGAVERASATLKNLEWFEISELRGHVVNCRVGHYQVVVKLGFSLEQ